MRYTILVGMFWLFLSSKLAGSPLPCPHDKPSAKAWIQTNLQSDDAVFLGVVISIDTPPESTAGAASSQIESAQSESAPANSMADLLKTIEAGQQRDAARLSKVVSFEVLSSWKEPKFPIVRTRSRDQTRSARSYPILGEYYLVSVRDYADEFYWTQTACNIKSLAKVGIDGGDVLNELKSLQ